MGAPTPRPPGGEATRRVLSIAGSDSGGGAGIQADLKAFARCGVHGMTAVTAITAQNTVGVSVVAPVAPEVVLEQIRCVLEDIGVDAVKVGMLGTVEVTLAVARALDQLPPATPVVVDQVMVSESGASLLDPDAQRVLLAEILPRATVLTPNVSEARVLAGEAAEPADDDAAAQALARAVLALGPRIVVLTGGHRSSASDLFLDSADPGSVVSIEGRRHPDGAAHGSGCTHSSTLAAHLALGDDPLSAARAAKAIASAAVRDGLRSVGGGTGPVDVFGLAARFRRRSAPDAPGPLT
ncbi:MAG: phosphomethylpyrimidine kinase [Solirubrobacterales bacterium]|nr:phosphomethylpyrimidine kinase [Solirubrobacterales bacterium]